MSSTIFKPSKLFVFEDNSYLFAADTYYYKTLGVSANSSMDQSFFLFDANRNIKWITSIDFSNKIDFGIGLKEFNNSLYGVLVNNYVNYCLFLLRIDNGSVEKSNWYTRSGYLQNNNITFSLNAATSQFLFWQEIDGVKNNDTTNYLYVFNSDSLLLSKIILINFSTSYDFYGSSSGYPYSFVFNFNQSLQMLQYDGQIGIKMNSLSFITYEDGGSYFNIGIITGNTSYFVYSKMMNYNSIQFGYSTYISMMPSFLELDTWQNYKLTDISK